MRRVFLILLAVAMFATVAPQPSGLAAAQPSDELPPDLAAMVLSPEDLAEADLEGFGVPYVGEGGQYRSLEEIVGSAAFIRDLTDEEMSESLEDAGWQTSYISVLQRLADSDDYRSAVQHGVASEIVAFADADGAAAAFAYLTEEHAPTEEMGYEFLRAPRLGDDAVVLLQTSEGSLNSGEEAARSLEVIVLTDRLIASVHAFDTTQFGFGENVPTEKIEALAKRLLERIETALDDREPGLGSLALQLGDGLRAEREEYEVLDGETIPYAGQPAAEFEDAAEANEDAGLIDRYRAR